MITGVARLPHKIARVINADRREMKFIELLGQLRGIYSTKTFAKINQDICIKSESWSLRDQGGFVLLRKALSINDLNKVLDNAGKI